MWWSWTRSVRMGGAKERLKGQDKLDCFLYRLWRKSHRITKTIQHQIIVIFNRRKNIHISFNENTHYSKSQFFVQKFNFDKTQTFPRVFHPIFFWQFFSWNPKLSTAKKSKTTTFSRVFYPKKIDNFLGKLKLNFWTKNEDFEQCVLLDSISEKIHLFWWQFCLSFCRFLSTSVRFR